MVTPVVQYILIRGDLIKTSKWPLGAVIAQACHASVAVIHLFYEDALVQEYLKDVNNMHKVILEVPHFDELHKLENILKENNIDHKVWIEQPENIPTCIAIKPYPKDVVRRYFMKYKLLA